MKIFLLNVGPPGGAAIIFPKSGQNQNLTPLLLIKNFCYPYSGGQLKRDGNISFCVSITTESIKTNNMPLKSPTKFLPEMKKNSNFSKNFGLLGPFLKKVVLENGQL